MVLHGCCLLVEIDGLSFPSDDWIHGDHIKKPDAGVWKDNGSGKVTLWVTIEVVTVLITSGKASNVMSSLAEIMITPSLTPTFGVRFGSFMATSTPSHLWIDQVDKGESSGARGSIVVPPTYHVFLLSVEHIVHTSAAAEGTHDWPGHSVSLLRP